MTILSELKNSAGIQNFALRLSDGMQEVFTETADAILFESAQAAKEQVSSESRKPRNRSGGYLQSIHSTAVKNRFQVIGQVASDHPQATVIEFGSRPHVIEAKDKNTLFWPGASFPVKKVNHPGTPAFRVLGKAVEEGLENARRIFNQAIGNKFST